MKWQVDVAAWTDKPSVIQAYSEAGEECDYFPERTCHPEPTAWANSGYDVSMCSECGGAFRGSPDIGFPNYCPSCGARVVEHG